MEYAWVCVQRMGVLVCLNKIVLTLNQCLGGRVLYRADILKFPTPNLSQPPEFEAKVLSINIDSNIYM